MGREYCTSRIAIEFVNIPIYTANKNTIELYLK